MWDEAARDEETGRVVVTRRYVCAVKVDHAAAMHGPLVRIPPGTELQVCDGAPDVRLVHVRWGRARYAVFAVDLHDQATDVS